MEKIILRVLNPNNLRIDKYIAENFFVTTVVILLLDVIGFIHLVNRDANPEYKITWLAVMMIPMVNFILREQGMKNLRIAGVMRYKPMVI